MNVIVSNKNQGLIASLDIDVIKSISGEFTVDEIIGTFSNFFFNRMFLDITAIKGYDDIANIQKLSMNIDTEKVILVLSNDLMVNNGYLSKIISLGIYNFGNTKESLMYLYNHPNSYKDVAHIHQLSGPQQEEASVEKKSKLFGAFGGNKTEEKSNSGNNGAVYAKVIGFKNATAGAGATTLVYMLKKFLAEKDYVVALEVNKNDFGFFNENNMFSINQNNFSIALSKFSNAKYILVDLNNYSSELCDELIYLVEPSTIKLNKMMLTNKMAFDKMYGHKIVLNKSLLTEKDVADFEHESNAKVFYNLPPLNDHVKNIEVLEDFMDDLEEGFK